MTAVRTAIRRLVRASSAALVTATATVCAAGQVQAAPRAPSYAHVVVVVEENHAASAVLGNKAAPFINSLAAGGALMTQSYAVAHPSQPNYLALFAGDTTTAASPVRTAGWPLTSPDTRTGPRPTTVC